MSDAMDSVRQRIKDLEAEVKHLEALRAELKALQDALASYNSHQLPSPKPPREIPSCGGFRMCGGCSICREGPDFR